MNQFKSWTRRAVFAATLVCTPFAHSQAAPTAVQQLQLSAFGGATGIFTDFYSGHNLGITAGADLSFYAWHGYHPAIEVRGTYPVYDGTISAQKSFLAGLKVERTFNRLHPYVDFLGGRGQIDYQNGGFPIPPSSLVISSTSTVYSFGGGVDYDFGRQWAAKVDYQVQSWSTPIAPYTTIHPSDVTVGVVYRFDFNHHYHRVKAAPPAPARVPAQALPPPPQAAQPDSTPPPPPSAQPDATPPPPPANAPPQ